MTVPNENDLEICDEVSDKPNIKGDKLNFCLLILLYLIQGFSVGLSMGFPILLQSEKKVTYEDQVSYK